MDVEDVFRMLKTTLELRPMFHWREERISAHILLSCLRLLLVRIVEVKTGDTCETYELIWNGFIWDIFPQKNGDVYQNTQMR